MKVGLPLGKILATPLFDVKIFGGGGMRPAVLRIYQRHGVIF